MVADQTPKFEIALGSVREMPRPPISLCTPPGGTEDRKVLSDETRENWALSNKNSAVSAAGF